MITYPDIKTFIAYVLIIFILYTTSGTSDFSNSKELLIGGWVFFTIAYFYIENLIKPSFAILTGVFIGISMVYFILNGAYNAVTYLGFFLKIYLAYYCRELCKEHFFDYFVKIIYGWTLICLVLFAAQLLDFEKMYQLNNLFGTEMVGDETDRTRISSSIVFTMLPIHAFRNCGFMWEPGAYVTVLVLTYYINLFHLKEPFSAKRNIVFLLAILTTQSTMGIIAILIPFLLLLKDFVMKNRTYQQVSVVLIPTLLIGLVIVFTQVDFLYKKMVQEVTNLEEELIEVEKGQEQDYVVSLTRSASVILDMKTIKEYPLLGIGVDMRTTGFSKLGYSEKLQTSCGTTILLLRFGLIGFIIYTILLYKSAVFESTLHKIGWVLLVNYTLFTQEFSASSFFHLFLF